MPENFENLFKKFNYEGYVVITYEFNLLPLLSWDESMPLLNAFEAALSLMCNWIAFIRLHKCLSIFLNNIPILSGKAISKSIWI